MAYDGSFGLIGAGVGYIYYGLDSAEDSQELYLSLAVNTILAPSLTIYRDMANYPGWYLNFALSHSFELIPGISMDIGGSVGYLSIDDGDNYCNEGLISLGFTVPFADYFSFNPLLAYSFPLSTEAEDALEDMDGDSSHVWGGLSLSMSF